MRRGAQAIFLIVLIVAARICFAAADERAAAAVAIGMTVSDLDESIEFYTEVLQFEVIDEHEVAGEALERLTGVFGARTRTATLALGDERIQLTEYLASPGRPIPIDSRSNDRWFQHIAIITRDMDAAYQRLRQYKVRHASSGPQRLPDWNPNAGGIEAFYFLDPDRHVLEILEFPPDKGDSKWRRLAAESTSDRLFLGIDHTAIVVADTDRSIEFYRDAFGLEVAGASENYGTEQEHLNNVFGARLRITSLRGRTGPAIELLEYLAPSDGRDFPADARPNDILHWQITLLTETAINSAIEQSQRAGARLLSSHPIESDDQPFSVDRACLLRDPDGHAILLAERSFLENPTGAQQR